MLMEIKRAPSLAVETGCKQHKKQRGRHLPGGGRYPMASGSSGVLSLSIRAGHSCGSRFDDSHQSHGQVGGAETRRCVRVGMQEEEIDRWRLSLCRNLWGYLAVVFGEESRCSCLYKIKMILN